MNCDVCGTPLTGGRDTFGDVGQTLCLAHWNEHVAIRPVRDIDKQIAEAREAARVDCAEGLESCLRQLEYLKASRAAMLTRLGLVEAPETLRRRDRKVGRDMTGDEKETLSWVEVLKIREALEALLRLHDDNPGPVAGEVGFAITAVFNDTLVTPRGFVDLVSIEA